jgi:hypothetical protein
MVANQLGVASTVPVKRRDLSELSCFSHLANRAPALQVVEVQVEVEVEVEEMSIANQLERWALHHNNKLKNIMNSITDENTNSMSLSQGRRQQHKVHSRTTRSRGTVSFGSVFTREYSVTVGDHHRSTDSAGLTLDWGFAAEYAVPVENSYSRKRTRRMSASERRKRICSVTGCLPSDVRAAEYNMALQRYNQDVATLQSRTQ